MIKYGLDRITELQIVQFHPSIERRDNQWIDIILQLELAEQTPAPADLIDLTALVICTLDGTIVQAIPQDEGCDCEYQFTFNEKEQISAYINQAHIQRRIKNLASPN